MIETNAMGRQRWSENFRSKSWESIVVYPLLKNAKRSWTRFSKYRVVLFYKIWPILSSSTSYVCQSAYKITLFFYTVRKIQCVLQRTVIKIIKCKDSRASLFLIKYYITLRKFNEKYLVTCFSAVFDCIECVTNSTSLCTL